MYSQRNRDKQKRQIQELSEMKKELEQQQMSLLVTKRDIESQLLQTQAQNQIIRRQLMARRQQEVIRVRHLEMAEREERQRRREEEFYLQQQQLYQQNMQQQQLRHQRAMMPPYPSGAAAMGDPVFGGAFGSRFPAEQRMPPTPPPTREMLPPSARMLPVYDPTSGEGHVPPNRMIGAQSTRMPSVQAAATSLPSSFEAGLRRQPISMAGYDAPMVSAMREQRPSPPMATYRDEDEKRRDTSRKQERKKRRMRK
jgi:hypothetical protein